ncbi:MAG: FecCD family ABC transporter permease, partial [Luteibaculum sp.]
MNKARLAHIILWIALVALVMTHLGLGENGMSLFGTITDNQKLIFLQFRLPKILAAISAGMAISVSGLLMQSYFRNPLAGPFVLGVSSGASLGVAIYLLGASVFPFLAAIGKIGLIGSALLGAMLVMLVVLYSSYRTGNSANLLVIGIMWASLTSALVGILEFFAGATQIKFFLIWSMGSLLNVGLADSIIIWACIVPGLLSALYLAKKLDIILLGRDYAMSMGVNYKQISLFLFLITCVLAGVTTAFVGPIAFLGLAVPHFARAWLQSNTHKKLIYYCCLLGAVFLLSCQLLCEYLLPNSTLPINLITSLIGAPVV